MTGRSRELAAALRNRRIDIACVQETKWSGAKAKDIGEGYKLYYNSEVKTQNGVSIVLLVSLKDSVVSVNRISDRIMSIEIDSGDVGLPVVSCYTPQVECSDEAKEEIWPQLEDHIRTFRPEERVIGGDLNGHVGARQEGYEDYHGEQGFGTRNEEGCKILDFAEAHNLAVTKTYFKKRPFHLITYASGGRSTQIHYWLTNRRNMNLVTNTKVIPSDNVAPQHHLLVMDMLLDIGQHRRPPTTGPARIKWWKLTENKDHFKEKIEQLAIDPDKSVILIWASVTEHIRKTAKEVVGETKPAKRFVEKQIWWWNEEVQSIVKEKKTAFKK
ncbi:craniofacial development protein 2-like [Betta splendens]|uniref:Craniofacial development protein 2-like n=1 Tax=Betta splendens TaxID=158456 RepID=A0A8M1HB66_BETSP|nr:craniofacial development protein 2-like [Betta splendens]